MTYADYADAVDWAIDNVLMDFYDSYDEWLDASKSELQTPELTNHPDFNKQMQQAWENEVGDIKKTRKQLKEEEEERKKIEEEQKRIEEFEEPEIVEPQIQEPTAKEVEHELERNLPPEQRSRDFITQEKTGALSNVLSSLPKGSKISIPQPKGAPIQIKPSVTFPTGITMTRPPITPTVFTTPVARVVGAVRSGVSTVTKAVRTGIRVVFRI